MGWFGELGRVEEDGEDVRVFVADGVEFFTVEFGVGQVLAVGDSCVLNLNSIGGCLP